MASFFSAHHLSNFITFDATWSPSGAPGGSLGGLLETVFDDLYSYPAINDLVFGRFLDALHCPQPGDLWCAAPHFFLICSWILHCLSTI